jgi:N-methylhydantoinase B/oxoprolinase/acetone carboxylase alpha subunit
MDASGGGGYGNLLERDLTPLNESGF